MSPLAKTRFEWGMYAAGTVAAFSMVLTSAIFLFGGIESASSNVLHILLGVMFGSLLSLAWIDTHAKLRQLAAQAAQERQS